ncbi:MAG: YjgN family protein [Burkholderiales bacterium]
MNDHDARRPRIADQLEPGPLRAELGGAALPPEPAPEPDGTYVTRMTFTGRGDEYFRIWIVNLFLTLVTLGIYSAWAKVRKTRYFWQNARLDGYVFDFHGRPLAILRGRILALALLVAYSWAFEFSLAAGLVTIVVLLAIGPWLFVKAQQFKFGNTSFRGLRFGFAASNRDGYRYVLPILLMWFSTTIATALMTSDRPGVVGAFSVLSIATVLLVPAMHQRLKAFQHRYATYGERRFDFAPALVEFYWVYAKGLLLLVLAGVLGATVLSVAMVPFYARGSSHPPDWLLFASGIGVVLIVYVVAWPFLAARLQQVVWAHTRVDDVRFRTEIAAWPLFKVVLRNVVLTLLTAGLYWPFAAVALARYRVECMRVDCDAPLATIAAGTFARTSAAVGDATADAFGLDLGL